MGRRAMTMDDPALVEAIRSGDPQATRLLVERYHGIVFGLCRRMLNHRHDAEDVTQETFLRALRAIFGFDSARPLRPWLLEIAANRCRTALALRARRPRLGPVAAAEDRVDPRPGVADPDDLAGELQQAVDRLRPEYRLVFLLYHEQNLSYEEIARSLERPVGTVKTWLHRARAELAELPRPPRPGMLRRAARLATHGSRPERNRPMNCHDFHRAWNELLDARPGGARPRPIPRRIPCSTTACRPPASTPATAQAAGGPRSGMRPCSRPSPPGVSAPPASACPSAELAERVLAALSNQADPFRPARAWAAGAGLGLPLGLAAAAAAAAHRPGDRARVSIASNPAGRRPRRRPPWPDSRILGDSLAEATAATWDLARHTSEPAARLGREVLEAAAQAGNPMEAGASVTLTSVFRGPIDPAARLGARPGARRAGLRRGPSPVDHGTPGLRFPPHAVTREERTAGPASPPRREPEMPPTASPTRRPSRHRAHRRLAPASCRKPSSAWPSSAWPPSAVPTSRPGRRASSSSSSRPTPSVVLTVDDLRGQTRELLASRLAEEFQKLPAGQGLVRLGEIRGARAGTRPDRGGPPGLARGDPRQGPGRRRGLRPAAPRRRAVRSRRGTRNPAAEGRRPRALAADDRDGQRHPEAERRGRFGGSSADAERPRTTSACSPQAPAACPTRT